MNRLKSLLLTVVVLFGGIHVNHTSAQVALKTNLLYDATTTPNLGLEVGLSRKTTAQVFYGLNPWTFNSESNGTRKAKHWLVMPELRFWPCYRFNGHFFGIHAMGGQFNAANVDIPLPGTFFRGDNLRSELPNTAYEGRFLGGGITYGYQWIISRHLNLEAEIGAGYDRVWFDKYECGECGSKQYSASTNYAGITKLGLSLMYLF